MKKIKAWWKRKNLARPDQIVRRLLVIPVVAVCWALLVVCALIGWGPDEAQDIYDMHRGRF